jgi:hypothetical protein
VMQQKLAETLTAAKSNWLPTKNVLNAGLVSQPVPELRRHLHSALNQAVHNFTAQFFELLARLVDRELVGLVEWFPNGCCSYHFFRRAVIQENDGAGPERIIDETFFREITNRDESTGRRIVGRRTVEKVKGQGRHYHRLARHEHEVMNAVHTSIANSAVLLPPQAERLVQAVPEWLYPFVQIIDGDIFRERIIEQDVRVETWSEVRVRDEPIIGCEPGVIFGPYVLTGWGPREDAAEKRRRREFQDAEVRLQSENSATWERFPWALGAGLTGVATIALLMGGQSIISQSSLCIPVLMILSLYALMQAIRLHGIAVRQPSRLPHYLSGLAIAFGLFAGSALLSLQHQFASGDGWLGWSLIAGSLCGLGLVRRLWPKSASA